MLSKLALTIYIDQQPLNKISIPSTCKIFQKKNESDDNRIKNDSYDILFEKIIDNLTSYVFLKIKKNKYNKIKL